MPAAERRSLRVSFAIRLVDDFSKSARLIGLTEVRVEGKKHPVFETSDGLHVLCGITETIVRLDAVNPYYLPAGVTVKTVDLDEKNPIVTVIVKPNAAYPFPDWCTLIRGSIVDELSNPIEGAEVSIPGNAAKVLTGGDGRFALYVCPLGEEDVANVKGRRVLAAGRATEIVLAAAHSSFSPQTVKIGNVPEGKLTLLKTPIVLCA